MNEALKEARKASSEGEIPVGAVIVCNSRIISRAYNMTETLNDVTAHAEIIAITAAESAINGKYLDECTMYVTLEPCVMCAGASMWARFARIVFGAYDNKKGASVFSNNLYHPATKIKGGVMASECADILSEFMKAKR